MRAATWSRREQCGFPSGRRSAHLRPVAGRALAWARAAWTDRGALAAPEAGTIAGCDATGSRDAASGLLRGGKCLRDEGPGLLRTS